MIFNSLSFFALLIPAVTLYWVLPWQVARMTVLFAASMVFYAAHHWPSLFLLLGTIGFNFGVGRIQERRRSAGILAVAVVVNLSLLGWFKYAAFLADNVNALLALAGVGLAVPRPPAFLPLGISFFTFQVVAYQVDVYRREVEAETSLLRFAVFKCFFPQLIAGPIVRARDFLPQLQQRRSFDAEVFHQGLWLLMAGLALKVGVADVLAQFADEAFRDPGRLTTTGAWMGVYAYAFQLFADFWGYSTMAVGLAALFGLTLPANFDLPYVAHSLRDFWRRWHITLSVWFRDYLYIPLGGNQRRRDLNLWLTMVVAGLWHGAAWTFVLWGCLHGMWLVLERHAPAWPECWEGRWGQRLRTLLLFQGVCLLWVLFRAPSLEVAVAYYGKMLLPPFTFERAPGTLVGWLVAVVCLQRPLASTLEASRFTRLPLWMQWAMAMSAAYLVLAYAGAKVDFIYFTF
jgi:D-alanyl-lipoteichoic acid acyltransferase DltB (MBOAT superfamily)